MREMWSFGDILTCVQVIAIIWITFGWLFFSVGLLSNAQLAGYEFLQTSGIFGVGLDIVMAGTCNKNFKKKLKIHDFYCWIIHFEAKLIHTIVFSYFTNPLKFHFIFQKKTSREKTLIKVFFFICLKLPIKCLCLRSHLPFIHSGSTAFGHFS